MANAYSKSQSTAIALWVLSLQNKRTGAPFEHKGPTAPAIITELVNALGPHHSPGSILLHTHGYDRLLLGREIERSISTLQKMVAQELISQGIVAEIFAD